MDCSRAAAAVHNLTVYGTEILYTATPTTGNAVKISNISFEFQLYNSLIDVDAQCSAHLSSLSESESQWTWPCFVESHDACITADFVFDLTAHELTVYESWVCGQSGETGHTVRAQGTNSIGLLCQETVSEIGQHYCAAAPAVPLPVNASVADGRGRAATEEAKMWRDELTKTLGC